jgi:ribosomal protein S18 acetylase RimI-like enzyme
MTIEPPDVVVRVVAGEADVASVASLRALWTGGVEKDPEFERRMATWLAVEGDRRTTWLAAVGELPVGMASLFEYRRMPKPGQSDSRWGYVGNLFVRAEFRNRGIGSMLLAALIATAEERSYARLVVSPSAAASSLYRRSGFLAPDGAAEADVLLVRPAR